MTEFTGKIVKFLCEKGQLFILLERKAKHSLKIYGLNKFRELEFKDEIPNISEQFVMSFTINKQIFSNVLIHNDKKITKIYEGVGGTKASLQDYINYWPDAEADDRQMLIQQ